MKLRGVSKEPLSSPKSFEFLLREMKSLSQTLSGSQDRSMAQEKSILKIVTCNFWSQNVSLDVIRIDVQLRFINQSKPSMWPKRKIKENDFYPPKCLCLLDYPLYKLRGLSGVVFRACISSFLTRKMIFPHIQELTMSNLDQMRATQFIHKRIERTSTVENELKSACAQRENGAQAPTCMMCAYGVE
jgi:hypothetical protein